MCINQMGGDKLILNGQLHRKDALFHVQRVLAASAEAIGQQDVYEIRYSSAMTEPSSTVVKPIHIHVVGESRKPQMAISQRRQQL